jgi:hypothetical protein
MAIERIDFDAENLAAENLAKGVEAAIAMKIVRGDPERLHFIVSHSPDLWPPIFPAPFVAAFHGRVQKADGVTRAIEARLGSNRKSSDIKGERSPLEPTCSIEPRAPA